MAHYVQNVWTNNVTPVDKAHMDVIEAGITEAADLYYLGDWVAGTYKEGDIVVYNGVAYVAVRQTTQTPVPWAAGQASLSYGTTLPSNPVDGQEAVLVDSLTNPSYQWRFRYNAGSTSAYKWECIGGTGRYAEVNPFEATTSTALVDLATVGPSFAIPRAGQWEVQFSAICANNAASTAMATVQLVIAGASGGNDGMNASLPGVANWGTTVSTTIVRAGNANDLFKVMYAVQPGNNVLFGCRHLLVRPVRVS